MLSLRSILTGALIAPLLATIIAMAVGTPDQPAPAPGNAVQAAEVTTAPPLTCRAIHADFTACAPSADLAGSPVSHVEEDGSATYADGAMYDAPSQVFSACWTEHKTGGLPDERICGNSANMPAGSTAVGPYSGR